jgi:hypothetical protein
METVAVVPYVPLAVDELTELTTGEIVSTAMFLLLPSEPDAPGVGSVSDALPPLPSVIVAPFRLSALTDV